VELQVWRCYAHGHPGKDGGLRLADRSE